MNVCLFAVPLVVMATSHLHRSIGSNVNAAQTPQTGMSKLNYEVSVMKLYFLDYKDKINDFVIFTFRFLHHLYCESEK